MKINFKNLKKNSSIPLLIVDGIMLNLIILNLLWMIFDFSFNTQIFQDIINQISKDFYIYYLNNIHPNFLFYDSLFVAIFMLEILIRWIVAIIKKEYSHWMSYLFVHWYDVLGCIPVGGFRSLRLLRILSIILRLHKKQIIDIRSTWWYKLFNRYYNILTEELSDKVVSNVISGMQDEIQEGAPIADEIIEKVLIPKQGLIVEFISHKMQIAAKDYHTKHSKKLNIYIHNTVESALLKNNDIKRLDSIPVVGKKITAALRSSIADVMHDAIEKIVDDLSVENNHETINELIEISKEIVLSKETDVSFREETKHIIIDSLEILKKQIERKRWKEK